MNSHHSPFVLAPDSDDRLADQAEKASVENSRDRDYTLIPKTKLRFGRHGLPQEVSVGDGEYKTNRIQIPHLLKPEARRRDAAKHWSVVAPEMSNRGIERSEQALMGRR